jgi:hypothetical protein
LFVIVHIFILTAISRISRRHKLNDNFRGVFAFVDQFCAFPCPVHRFNPTPALRADPPPAGEGKRKLIRRRQSYFTVSPVPDISFGFQLTGADQNLHACVNFFRRYSNAALLERAQSPPYDSCDLQPLLIAEGQEHPIDV